jgi:hypothetical protein
MRGYDENKQGGNCCAKEAALSREYTIIKTQIASWFEDFGCETEAGEVSVPPPAGRWKTRSERKSERLSLELD